MERRLLLEKLMVTMPQLDTPTISLSGDTLSIEEVEDAEYYDIYDGDTLVESVPAVSGYTVFNWGTFNNGNTPVCEYSLDNGTTWNSITDFTQSGSGTVATNVTQIKFRLNRAFDSDSDSSFNLECSELSIDETISGGGSGYLETQNYTLTEDITISGDMFID